jgi:hypothetical protein
MKVRRFDKKRTRAARTLTMTRKHQRRLKLATITVARGTVTA